MIGGSELGVIALIAALVVVVPWLRRGAERLVDEEALGRAALAQVRAEHRVDACDDPLVSEVIRAFQRAGGVRVARAMVVRADGLNAAALADGTVLLWADLVAAARAGEIPRDELAGVIAHELAHIALGHGRRRAAADRLAAPLLVLARVGFLAAPVMALLRRGASRQAELEADQRALVLLRRAGFDPRGLSRFLSRLSARAAREPAWTVWLSTHPHLPDRVAALDAG
jgi:metalloprotease